MIAFSGSWGSGSEWDFVLAGVEPDLPVTSVFGVFLENGKVGLTKNERGWELPGGHVNKGESHYDALVRELHEEVGVVIATAKLYGYIDIRNTTVRLNDDTGEPYPDHAALLFYTVNGTWTGMHDPKEAVDCGLFDLDSPEANNRLKQFVDAALGKYTR